MLVYFHSIIFKTQSNLLKRTIYIVFISGKIYELNNTKKGVIYDFYMVVIFYVYEQVRNPTVAY